MTNEAATPPSSRRSPAASTPKRRRTVLASEQTQDLSPVLVGVYIRVSMAREEMISPELQQRDVDAYLARMTAQTGRLWRAVVVEQDLDVSGRSFARAGIQGADGEDAPGGDHDHPDLPLRPLRPQPATGPHPTLTHLDEVESLDGQVVSVTEPMDATTAVGHYMRSNTLALAEMQSRSIGEGWKRVQQYRVERGLPTNGRERYGYLAHRATQQRGDGAWRMCPQGCAVGDCQTAYATDPETGPIMQRIYQAYVGGRGFQAIAKALNDDDLICPNRWGALRSGNASRISRTAATTWTAGSVIDIADSGFAASLITHNGQWYPGAHAALISKELWQAYQKRRDAQRLMPTRARSPKWSLAGIARCGQCGGPMYCTSSGRGEQYALYCGTQRPSGTCTGTYRTRAPVEAAVALWLQRYASELEEATRNALAEQPATPSKDPHAAERRRLTKVIDESDVKVGRLLDAYTDGALDLATWKQRRETVRGEAEQARSRLAELDTQPQQPPAAATITTFADTWPTLSVDARRDVASALLTAVHVHADKTVELLPRWSEPATVTFTKRGALPALSPTPDDVR